MTTTKPRARKQKQQNKQALMRIERIPVERVVVGDLIVSKTRQLKFEEMTEEQQNDFLYGSGEHPETVASSFKVHEKCECPGKWRTHVHINKSMCYDIRSHVRIALPPA